MRADHPVRRTGLPRNRAGLGRGLVEGSACRPHGRLGLGQSLRQLPAVSTADRAAQVAHLYLLSARATLRFVAKPFSPRRVAYRCR